MCFGIGKIRKDIYAYIYSQLSDHISKSPMVYRGPRYVQVLIIGHVKTGRRELYSQHASECT